ncbi:unnamed protein product [Ectocarpus sp. 12 AP-2014]
MAFRAPPVVASAEDGVDDDILRGETPAAGGDKAGDFAVPLLPPLATSSTRGCCGGLRFKLPALPALAAATPPSFFRRPAASTGVFGGAPVATGAGGLVAAV